jgi:SAM-dependent methyltransferase
MNVFTTEITSQHLPSDNPLHQRLLKPYLALAGKIRGDVLELGCGEGRGVEVLAPAAKSYTGVDKIAPVVDALTRRFPGHRFICMKMPPLTGLADNSYDAIVAFQVIEHIADDRQFLREIYRVLRPGGRAFLTTPNRSYSLTRNPWHVREYLPEELGNLAKTVFEDVELSGISGNDRVMEYYQRNKLAVRKITRWDVFRLQHRLPSWMLRWPYEILNRLNRIRLRTSDQHLVSGISADDYLLVGDPEKALDLLGIFTKAPSDVAS